MNAREEISRDCLFSEKTRLRQTPIFTMYSSALESVEFLVVQDIFHTETTRFAHVILPGASFAEKDGTFTNGERRVQRVRKAIEPIAGMAEWQVIMQDFNSDGLSNELQSSVRDHG